MQTYSLCANICIWKKFSNHEKRTTKISRDYEKIDNQKDDLANKLVHEIDKAYDVIAIQDEMISKWRDGFFGRNVQHSAMGKVKARLKDNPRTIVVESSFPSTQRCPMCGLDTKHLLSKRDYDCRYCGYHHDNRDQKSAEMILQEALKQNVCVERTAKSPAKAETSVGEKNSLYYAYKSPPIDRDKSSLPGKQEAQIIVLGSSRNRRSFP